MTLATLIRKSARAEVATATPATVATDDGRGAADGAGSVASVATVAVAKTGSEYSAPGLRPATAAESAELAAAGGRHFRWRITAAGRAPLELRCSPEATAAELAALYPGAILEALPDDDQGDDGTEAGGPKASLTGDDRRRCTDCANLAPGGRCRAAARGELPYAASRRYEPAPDLPKRCEGFAPRPGDPDRRPGRERWPGLMDDGGAD